MSLKNPIRTHRNSGQPWRSGWANRALQLKKYNEKTKWQFPYTADCIYFESIKEIKITASRKSLLENVKSSTLEAAATNIYFFENNLYGWSCLFLNKNAVGHKPF